MGTWGPGLYQNDLAEDVKTYYNDQLRKGKNENAITQALIHHYTASKDMDDIPVFWFALADTQWNLGRLDDFVKEQALFYLQKEETLLQWKQEHPTLAARRATVLSKLEEKLLSPQPAKKKITQHRLYSCEWKIGDVFAYELDSDYAKAKNLDKRYFLFHKIGETTYHPGHIVPIVRVKITKSLELPCDEQSFNELEYVQIYATPFEDRFLPFDARRPMEEQILEKSKIKYECDEFGFLPQYRLILANTSKRIIPKKLLYVGNFQNVKPPKIEFIPHSDFNITGVIWKFLEEILIDSYCGYNLRQYKHYKKKDSE